jgi:hypothetical protein
MSRLWWRFVIADAEILQLPFEKDFGLLVDLSADPQKN